jgi:excisionase family DNA binding protein
MHHSSESSITKRTRSRPRGTVGHPGSTVLYTVPEACQMLRISRWMLYRLIQTRRLTTIKIGSRRLIPTDEITSYIQRLVAEGEPT